jgi:hypothetical protein
LPPPKNDDDDTGRRAARARAHPAADAQIGLQFVVMTLVAQRPPLRAAEAGAAFATPTIVHFGTALLLSAPLRAPWQAIVLAAALWGLIGLGGIAYALIISRRMRGQTTYQPEFEDWLFHALLPFAAYAMLALSALAASSHTREGPVWCWSCDAAVALHRHSQRLGQHRLPCICQQA